MSLILRKDPIVEAVCEIQLDAPDWDLTVPGVVYRRLKEDYPDKREAPHIELQINMQEDGPLSSAQTSVGRMQFWSADRKQVVQIGPQHLSIHQLKPYTGWPVFKARIEKLLAEYEQEAPFRAITAMSLRYINQIKLPDTPAKFEHILRAMPRIPNSADQIWTSWFQQVEILKLEYTATLGVRSGYLPQQSSQQPMPVDTSIPQFLMFDLMFAHVGRQPIERNQVSSWLDIAHHEIEELFFSSIREEYLPTFEPEVKENAL